MAEKGAANYDIFISYHRDGGDILAKLLYETLRNKQYSVFFDYESLSSGDYREKILETVRGAKDVIVVLSRDCLERCKNSDDLMCEEITEAINHNKNVMSVFLDNFQMPTQQEKQAYPDGVQKLLKMQGYRIEIEHYDNTLRKICNNLESQPILYQEKDAHRAVAYLLKNGTADLREEEKTELFSGMLTSSYGADIAEIMASFLSQNPKYYKNIRTKFRYEISLRKSFDFGNVEIDREKYFELTESLSYKKHFLHETVGQEYWISFVRNLDEVDDSLRDENYIFSENLLMDEADLCHIAQMSPEEQMLFYTKRMHVRFNLNGKVLAPVELIMNPSGIFAKYEMTAEGDSKGLDVKINFTIPHRKTASYFFASISDPTYSPHISFTYPDDAVDAEMISFMNRNLTTKNSKVFDGLREISLEKEWVLPMSGVVFIITPL